MKEIFLGTVTVEGWEKIKIEGQKGIIGYSAEEVAFRVPGGLLRIRGNALNIDEISAEISAETSFEQEDGLVWLVTGKEDISYDIPVWYRFEYNEHGVWEKITTSNVLEHS